MLFDLRGKRKRVVQVVYAALAFLMAASLFTVVGPLDIFGGGDGGTGNPQFDEQIADAEARLDQDPRDQGALLQLTEAHASAAKLSTEADEVGNPVIDADAQAEYEAAADAWERYLALKPKKPDSNVAIQAVNVYVLLGDPEGAAEAQRIYAEAEPSEGAFSNLAYYYYIDLDTKRGDEAAEQAIEELKRSGASASEIKAAEKELDALGDAAREAEKQQEKQQQNPPENPFEGTGGSLGGDAAPPSPAPAP